MPALRARVHLKCSSADRTLPAFARQAANFAQSLLATADCRVSTDVRCFRNFNSMRIFTSLSAKHAYVLCVLATRTVNI